MPDRQMLLRMLPAAGVAACLVAAQAASPGGVPSAASAGSSASGRTIVIEGMQYAPATLVVRRGERVTWVNRDLVVHTVTARDASFDSGPIAAGASWSKVMARVGAVDYACTFHPTMTAHLVVR